VGWARGFREVRNLPGRREVFALGVDYEQSPHRTLQTAMLDARRLAEFLQVNGGFRPHVADGELSRAQASTVIEHIGAWVARVRHEDRLATLIFYLCGHGVIERGEHYTLAAPSPVSGPMTGRTAIKAAAIIDEILVSGASQALLIFDSCHAATAGADLLDALRRVTLMEAGPAAEIVVLAACLPYETATSGALVSNMLAALEEGFGSYNPAERFEFIDVVDLRDELRRRLGSVQTVTVIGTGGRRVIPNPRYRPNAGDRRVYFSTLLSELAEEEREHFLRKAAGTDADDLWLFTGRRAASSRVVRWLTDHREGMLVITGPPGTGKSSFIGRLAVLADPASQDACRKLGLLADEVATIPPCGAFDAVLHLKNQSLDHVTADLARQLGINLGSSTAPARDLKVHLLDSGRPVTILADALDEATRGEEGVIALEILRSIASLPECRVVVGTRRDRDGRPRSGSQEHGPLIAALHPRSAHFEVVDLGAENELHEDISAYVTKGLASCWPTEDRRRRAGMAVAVMADGVFLYAQFALRVLQAENEEIVDDPNWTQRLLQDVKTSGLAQMLERDLARFDQSDRVVEILRPLAFARGKGLPRRRIWPDLASELSTSGRAYNETDIALVIRKAGWYLIEATEGGEAVYRLYHQSMSDYLRDEAVNAF
jgi:Caspase domain